MAVPDVRALEAIGGSLVASVKRIGKSVVLELGPKERKYLVFYLRMTGRLLLRPGNFREDQWVRIILELERDGVLRELRFADPRMFGFAEAMGVEKFQKFKEKFGPDALDPDLKIKGFQLLLGQRRTAVKKVLLEQSLIAGVGNIYANESLFLSRIHPLTYASELSLVAASALLRALRVVLKEGIEHRGSTLKDKMYVDIFGREGKHQNYFRVFGKSGEPCPVCKTSIRFLSLGGRATFYCPNCQPDTERAGDEGLRLF